MRARPSREPVVAGVSVSVSGPLRRQGQEACDGIRLWVDHVACAGGLTLGRNRSNRPLRLVALDDASSASRARENVTRLLTEERVDLLLGPYGSGSTLAVAPLAAALADRPSLLVVAGRFEDDVAITRERRLLETVGTVACVAAGTAAFHQELGVLAEAVIGPSQWEPHVYERPSIGPPSAWFCSEFRRVFLRDPGYVAAQAYALGIIIGEVNRRPDRPQDRDLLAAARRLDTTGLYGRFRLDPGSLRQVGHEILLVEWRDGQKHPLERTGVMPTRGGPTRER